MKDKLFYIATGELSSYSLACGYIDKREKDGIEYQLWREHDCYHVRILQNNTRLLWESFPLGELTRARRLYRSKYK